MNGKIENKWQEELTNKIRILINLGYSTLEEIIPKCDGAQPKDIKKIYDTMEIFDCKKNKFIKTKELYTICNNLPAANPLFYQWWYTAKSRENILTRVLEIKHDRVLCLGTPTIAIILMINNINTTLFDIDGDIIENLKVYDEYKNFQAYKYNVWTDLDKEYLSQYDIVIIDPPWYQEYFEVFFTRAIQASQIGGTIFCSFPQILTRPGIENDRKLIINKLIELGQELIYIERNVLEYEVPIFEKNVNNTIVNEFNNLPWRRSDLISIKVNSKNVSSVEHRVDPEVKSYYINNQVNRFRIFLKMESIHNKFLISENKKFAETYSRREDFGKVNLWTSDKKGYIVEDIKLFDTLITLWSKNIPLSSIFNHSDIQEYFENKDEIENLINKIEDVLEIWDKTDTGSIKRTDEEIKKKNEQVYSKWSSKASDREYHTKNDGYRIEFQRDRDRVIWSSTFRKLADKTQLFPNNNYDFVRQRITHSIEVFQLASTISASFGLNKDLVEAASLAHDIGHTPFGHSGELALNQIMKKLNFECGFNHYEHGVDVVRYLESPYRNIHLGLDLTPEVCECILKHTYNYYATNEYDLSTENIYKHSKHKKYIKEGFPTLEGQAVRAADKISYLISDIEDGINIGAISYNDLNKCRLFNKVWLSDVQDFKDDVLNAFLSIRSQLISLLMEDLIEESARRISKIKDKKDVRNHSCYLIFHSDEINSDMDEIWKNIQVKKLHNNSEVLSMNLKASRIISEITILFLIFPEYIDKKYINEHKNLISSEYVNFYRRFNSKVNIHRELLNFLPLDMMIGVDDRKISGIDPYYLVLAKDYVASLSNKRIVEIYDEIFV